ncbi:hypothetical protein CSUNSWCD_533 [Campylobacter showae CSUNSWCD]|uniref:Uncharacterized protein n=1 Tax=Campylobacter showae CSUNSWCD TaxID=1244083 RepID=M5IEB3_9BACT|nr:hypothetical protein CSUNSWCD_533 [Campylobacter showae CSUNSWCD]
MSTSVFRLNFSRRFRPLRHNDDKKPVWEQILTWLSNIV